MYVHAIGYLPLEIVRHILSFAVLYNNDLLSVFTTDEDALRRQPSVRQYLIYAIRNDDIALVREIIDKYKPRLPINSNNIKSIDMVLLLYRHGLTSKWTIIVMLLDQRDQIDKYESQLDEAIRRPLYKRLDLPNRYNHRSYRIMIRRRDIAGMWKCVQGKNIWSINSAEYMPYVLNSDSAKVAKTAIDIIKEQFMQDMRRQEITPTEYMLNHHIKDIIMIGFDRMRYGQDVSHVQVTYPVWCVIKPYVCDESIFKQSIPLSEVDSRVNNDLMRNWKKWHFADSFTPRTEDVLLGILRNMNKDDAIDYLSRVQFPVDNYPESLFEARQIVDAK